MVWRPSWSCDQDHLNKLSFPQLKDSIWNRSSNGPVVSEEKMYENVGRRRTDGWTQESLVYYYLTNEPSAQVS